MISHTGGSPQNLWMWVENNGNSKQVIPFELTILIFYLQSWSYHKVWLTLFSVKLVTRTNYTKEPERWNNLLARVRQQPRSTHWSKQHRRELWEDFKLRWRRKEHAKKTICLWHFKLHFVKCYETNPIIQQLAEDHKFTYCSFLIGCVRFSFFQSYTNFLKVWNNNRRLQSTSRTVRTHYGNRFKPEDIKRQLTYKASARSFWISFGYFFLILCSWTCIL